MADGDTFLGVPRNQGVFHRTRRRDGDGRSIQGWKEGVGNVHGRTDRPRGNTGHALERADGSA